jgi:preprotein translocase subunit YajC
VLKDATGYELKEGDKVVVQIGGLVIGTVVHITDGGLTIVDTLTATSRQVESMGQAVIQVDIPMQFNPKQLTTLHKYTPKSENDSLGTKEDAKPN